ncbi:MAG: hypothetical protein AUH05_17330 [Ktedonobacter sp. 13_2_20CM_53_11]|nr:MAG: hypothetical protein AUH05_17330 [Ktedonobacter sp. 13_2_20CM_53_11]
MTVEQGTNAHLAKVHLSFKPGSPKRLIRSTTIVSHFRRDLTTNLSREVILEKFGDHACHPERSEGSGEPDEEIQSSCSEPTLREAKG